MRKIIGRIKRKFTDPSYDEVLIGSSMDSDYDHPKDLPDTPQVLEDIWGDTINVCFCGYQHTIGEDVPLKLFSFEGMSDTAVDYIVLDDSHKYIVSIECSETEDYPVLEIYEYPWSEVLFEEE